MGPIATPSREGGRLASSATHGLGQSSFDINHGNLPSNMLHFYGVTQPITRESTEAMVSDDTLRDRLSPAPPLSSPH